jgi:hypothetical protein
MWREFKHGRFSGLDVREAGRHRGKGSRPGGVSGTAALN